MYFVSESDQSEIVVNYSIMKHTEITIQEEIQCKAN